MKKIFVYLSLAIPLALPLSALSKEIPYHQDDRDRLIRIEEGLKAVNQRTDTLERSLNQRIDTLERSLNQRIDTLERSLNQRIDGLQNLLYVVLATIFAQIVGVIGFVLWDRRTALAPAISKTRELEEREERVEKALKEFATRDPDVADILKRAGLL